MNTVVQVCSELDNLHFFLSLKMLENELLTWETKVTELVFLGEEMASQGHFDAQNILKGSKSVTDR